MEEQLYPNKRVAVLVRGVFLRGTITPPRSANQAGLRIWLDQPLSGGNREIFAYFGSIKPLDLADREITVLRELQDTFSFAAPVKSSDGRQGVIVKVPDHNGVVLVAFPVPVKGGYHMDRQEMPCSELKRIFPTRPAPVGFSLT